MTRAHLPDYPYATGDLLAKPNTYFYSPYHGAGFLLAWRKQRRAAAAPVTDAAPPKPACRATDSLLRKLLGVFSRHEDSTEAHQTLRRLLQRFEVTKRLHGDYSDAWRPVDPDDYLNLERYLAFARVLALAYEQGRFLPYLNCLLKCLDTLTCKRQEMSTSQQAELAGLLALEERFVKELAESLGLPPLPDDDALA